MWRVMAGVPPPVPLIGGGPPIRAPIGTVAWAMQQRCQHGLLPKFGVKILPRKTVPYKNPVTGQVAECGCTGVFCVIPFSRPGVKS